MGYTHYGTNIGCTKNLAAFAQDVIAWAANPDYGYNIITSGSVTLDPPGMDINGNLETYEFCEDFSLPYGDSMFCKTARQPYDAVVTAILIGAIIFGVDGSETIWSDGDYEDWDASNGVDLFLDVYNSDPRRYSKMSVYALPDCKIQKKNLKEALSYFLHISPSERKETFNKEGDLTNYILELTFRDGPFRTFYKKKESSESDVACEEASTVASPETLLVRYHSDEIEHLRYIDGEKSNWIDLRAAEDVVMKQGDFKLISLGIAVQLPKGYEMIIAPRSSTFKNFGILQANGIGIIDESYCGDNDILRFPALAMRDTEIHVNDRICQFRIQKHQPGLNVVEVEKLEGKDRGGFGSTGKR